MTNPASLLLGAAPDSILLQQVVGHVVRSERLARNMLATELAKRMDATNVTISKIETGTQQIDVETVWRLSQVFGYSSDHFMVLVEHAVGELEERGVKIAFRTRGVKK